MRGFQSAVVVEGSTTDIIMGHSIETPRDGAYVLLVIKPVHGRRFECSARVLKRLLELLTFSVSSRVTGWLYRPVFPTLPKRLTIAAPSRPANAHPYDFANEYGLMR
jgi:hypothetical protein